MSGARPHLFAALAVLGALSGCPRSTQQEGTTPAVPQDPPAPQAEGEPLGDEADRSIEMSHKVVFADRTSQGYLLLVDDGHAAVPTRDGLVGLVQRRLGSPDQDPELELLVELIRTPPMIDDPKLAGRPNDGSPRETTDLLGLHIEVLPLRSDGGDLVTIEQLTDPILTRDLAPEDRASLARRNQAILLRVDYRNRFGVRGLRMLQTLVRLVAEDREALVLDPDTGETMTPATFTQRRLQSSLSNIADQVAVVPFPDPRHGEGFVRLSTRGMRRFGSVDLELDGLPRDPQFLQSATHLLYGLAYRLIRLGEFDESGYAVEVPQTVIIDRNDIVQAYQRREDRVPDCQTCPGAVEVHLVERTPEPQDPEDHVMARVVAPREISDEVGYSQPQWALGAVRDLLGP